jgi:MFS family permease
MMADSTLMASSHPVITSYFHASNSASWLSTAFLLTSTSLQPLMGRLSDTIGRRPLYLAGITLITATTAWCALAQSIGSFIAARAFCGIGAAGLLSMGESSYCFRYEIGHYCLSSGICLDEAVAVYFFDRNTNNHTQAMS